jgi:hypothetical protein
MPCDVSFSITSARVDIDSSGSGSVSRLAYRKDFRAFRQAIAGNPNKIGLLMVLSRMPELASSSIEGAET